MRHYVTYFDHHFLSRGLALYGSLARQNPSFCLWVLCLDDECARILQSLRLTRLRVLRLEALEAADPALAAVKGTRTGVEYYWTCGPALLKHLLDRHPDVDLWTYLDADLYFLGSPEPLFDELGEGSMLIIPHRVPGSKGTYNVGWIIFRRTPSTMSCLNRWREQCIEWCFDRVEDGKFGDQAYLDSWPSTYPGTVVSGLHGAGLARWNDYGVTWNGRTLLAAKDQRQPVIFYHFSNLQPVSRRVFDAGLRRRGPMTAVVRRHVYVPYIRDLIATEELVSRLTGMPVAAPERSSWWVLLRKMMDLYRAGQLVVVPKWQSRTLSDLEASTIAAPDEYGVE